MIATVAVIIAVIDLYVVSNDFIDSKSIPMIPSPWPVPAKDVNTIKKELDPVQNDLLAIICMCIDETFGPRVMHLLPKIMHYA